MEVQLCTGSKAETDHLAWDHRLMVKQAPARDQQDHKILPSKTCLKSLPELVTSNKTNMKQIVFNHEADSLSEALGISKERVEELNRKINNFASHGRNLQELQRNREIAMIELLLDNPSEEEVMFMANQFTVSYKFFPNSKMAAMAAEELAEAVLPILAQGPSIKDLNHIRRSTLLEAVYHHVRKAAAMMEATTEPLFMILKMMDKEKERELREIKEEKVKEVLFHETLRCSLFMAAISYDPEDEDNLFS